MSDRDKRNLNPTKEAVAAMWLWGREYSEQRGGSMDFYDKLEPSRKRHCQSMIDEIEKSNHRSRRVK